MSEALAVLAAGLSLIGAALYSFIGGRFLRAASPLPWFGTFWGGIAAYGILDAGWSLLVRYTSIPLAFGILVLQLKIVVATVAFFGLVYYLVFVYSGTRKAFWPLVGFYALVLAFVVYSYAARMPVGQEMRTWGAGLVYARPGGLVSDLAYALLFGPPLVASLAYAALLPRTRSRAQRQRVLATSAALVLFFGSLLLGWTTNAIPHWPLYERALALLLALAVLRSPSPQAGRRGDEREGPEKGGA